MSRIKAIVIVSIDVLTMVCCAFALVVTLVMLNRGHGWALPVAMLATVTLAFRLALWVKTWEAYRRQVRRSKPTV